MKIYKNENHAIIHGDVMEVLSAHIPDASVDLVFADPPYNIGKNFNGRKDRWSDEKEYLNWSYEWIDLCIKKTQTRRQFLSDGINPVNAPI